jgi:hypothetical protein
MKMAATKSLRAAMPRYYRGPRHAANVLHYGIR